MSSNKTIQIPSVAISDGKPQNGRTIGSDSLQEIDIETSIVRAFTIIAYIACCCCRCCLFVFAVSVVQNYRFLFAKEL